MDSETLVKLENVSVNIEGNTLLENISLKVNKGDRICIRGASGSGKTTLLRVITGFQEISSGEIEKADVRMAVMFQEDRLLLHRNALGNLKAVGVEKEKAEKYLKKVGLGGDMKKRPSQLSGGMKRRLALARALAYGGELYVFDEPLTGLERETAEKMLMLIKEETQGKTFIMITHDDFSQSILDSKVFEIGREDEKQ